MTQSNKRIFKCPKCNSEFTMDVYDVINVKEDEHLIERVLSGDCFVAECPKCHSRFVVQHDCLYHNPDKKFMVYLCHEKITTDGFDMERMSTQGYTLRWCKDIGSFIEKIQVLEDGLDDRAVEFAKYDSFIDYIQNKGEHSDITGIYYQEIDNGILKIKVELDDKAFGAMIPYDALIAEMEEYADMFALDTDFFPCVDSKWIIDIFEEAQEKLVA